MSSRVTLNGVPVIGGIKRDIGTRDVSNVIIRACLAEFLPRIHDITEHAFFQVLFLDHDRSTCQWHGIT